ncbi:Serine/arginine-rich splicing factor 3 [Myotis brandtii]|uniref:Serine/arginine-rich splicing factor 3 n=1 Tax=Myotis brandtii TaxID=109478 RepID=S7MDU9_MYOBR|nr:Serine/arginine-rich splicing factor 3 [Myotis brandtii]
MHRDSCPLDCKVYVGNLGNKGNKTELKQAFGYYGSLRSVWVARNPPGFAFVEFEDHRDAADAVRELDGRTLCGYRVRVELSNGEKRSRNRGPPPSWGRRPRDDYLIIGEGVLHLAADLQDREASPVAGAGPFPEIGGEKDHCLGREIISRIDPSLGQMKGNRRPVCKMSGVQEITSFDRSMHRKFKFCSRLHKLGAFLRCFSCSHLFVLEQ